MEVTGRATASPTSLKKEESHSRECESSDEHRFPTTCSFKKVRLRWVSPGPASEGLVLSNRERMRSASQPAGSVVCIFRDELKSMMAF